MRKTTITKAIILFVGLFVTTTSMLPAIRGDSTIGQTTRVTRADAVTIAVQTSGDSTTLHYTFGAFSNTPIKIGDAMYNQISLGEEACSLIAGAPDLPSVSRSIIIPDAVMTVHVISSSYADYTDIHVVPSKGNLLRTVNPADVPYTFGPMYTEDAWYPARIAELQDSYYLRDYHGQVVTLYPFQYNPVKTTLRVYNDITVEVSPSTQFGTNSPQQFPTKVDSDFLQLYKEHFLNFDTGRYTPVPEQGNLLVITYDDFYDAMVPFVEWKNLKGVPTEMVDVSTIGDANAIKNYIADYYNTKGLAFVLLVGDAAQVPTLRSQGGASDPSYGFIVGNDHYADLFVGRFSAENIAQVETQVNRTITYERDPQAGAGWYKNGTGIGSPYGVGDDNEYDYQHIRNIRTLLLNFTYSYVDEFYGGSQGGNDSPGDPTPTMVANALNDGRTIINYCGHGSPTSWDTSGFSNNNVNALTNENMLPFIVSVACNNGEFDDTTCFGEAWLRATHDGQPTGAIGAYMSSISQSWSPPMEAQDEFNNILVGKYENNTKTTYGGLCYNGADSMIDKYGQGGIEMADTWIVFGDPSVQVRTDTPANLTVTCNSTIPLSAQTFDVEVPGVANALCAISYQGTLLGNGYTDAEGHAVITFFEPLDVTGAVQLVVTAFNAIPHIADVTAGYANLPPDTPAAPTGQAKGKPGDVNTYSTHTTDPDSDTVFYMWNWGDGNVTSWMGPYDSGAVATAQKSWPAKGTYSVKVKAKDVYGHESNWSDPLKVTMPSNLPLLERFGNFFEQVFPRLYHFFEVLVQHLRV
ncbi:MAG TPA: C25 family cysteine peptidase [Candidatus Thermoplasmatota archaeon]|nr:C25 family cysteine peptidase [Candidatus Thermoplasmatota archaeon]